MKKVKEDNKEQWFDDNDQLFKEIIIYYKNGQKEYEIYYLNDKCHREDDLAFQWWYENGQKELEEHYLNGKLYKEGGPARQHWYKNGQKKNLKNIS